MLLWVEVCFDSAHRLAFHKGKCKNLHGHTYKLQAAFQAAPDEPVVGENGMICDFGDVKGMVRDIVSEWDHALIVDEADAEEYREMKGIRLLTLPGPPTAEHMALIFGAQFRMEIEKRELPVELARIKLYETPTSWIEARFVDA